MKSSFQNLALWFFPTRYFDNYADLQEWQTSYRKEYATLARGAAAAAFCISIILYYVADIHRFSSPAGLNVAITYRIFAISSEGSLFANVACGCQ
jgi:hypothetical protein